METIRKQTKKFLRKNYERGNTVPHWQDLRQTIGVVPMTSDIDEWYRKINDMVIELCEKYNQKIVVDYVLGYNLLLFGILFVEIEPSALNDGYYHKLWTEKPELFEFTRDYSHAMSTSSLNA